MWCVGMGYEVNIHTPAHHPALNGAAKQTIQIVEQATIKIETTLAIECQTCKIPATTLHHMAQQKCDHAHESVTVRNKKETERTFIYRRRGIIGACAYHFRW